ncbi:MAG: 5-formyltetrahydrofolate cyclo-ligase [Clostridia bacterium]|nr:5-formyltetrahydrofolate cyclo-ligase [Clostridia bacterium]
MYTKIELRKEMREKRKRMTGSPETTFLSALPTGETFFVYRSFGSEASTDKLIHSLVRLGKRVVTPRIEGTDMFAVEEGTLFKNRYGIWESDGAIYRGIIDVAVIPLLAADRTGRRLGYGGGFYDRFLSRTPCVKVGLCYEEQLLDEIPSESHDVLLDFVCTEQKFSDVRRSRT